MIRIESLLRREIGLDAASIGTSQIQRTVRLRMKARALKRVEDYEKLLLTSATELNELIEAVVVTETWFFRDREPFATFILFARQWLTANPNGTLRALSVPCSSGEEPYSLSMALLDENLPPHRYSIDAVDISSRALARAQQGVYGRNSFRGKTLDFRDRHFTPHKDGYLLNPRVRESVHFHHDNLLGERFLTGQASYNFIFCRNLLIYFDRATQERALERIRQLLSAEGILFVGPAELPLVTECGFVGANQPMSFACRKNTAKTEPRKPNPITFPNDGIWKFEDAKLPPFEFRPNAPLSSPKPEPLVRSSPTPAASTGLNIARQLADAGKLEEAALTCEDHLRRHGPAAEAYYLLGLMAEARESNVENLAKPPDSRAPTAIEYYRKTLYLEPNHYEALLHLALLLEKNGDAASREAARQYKRRAERVQTRNGGMTTT